MILGRSTGCPDEVTFAQCSSCVASLTGDAKFDKLTTVGLDAKKINAILKRQISSQIAVVTTRVVAAFLPEYNSMSAALPLSLPSVPSLPSAASMEI